MTRTTRTFIAAGLAAAASFVVAPPMTLAAGPEPVGAQLLPTDGAGRAARAFISMINDGTPAASKAFESAHRSPAQQSRVSAEERVTRLAELHDDLAPLRIQEILDAEAGGLTVLARDGHDRFVTMEFMFDAQTDHKIEGVRLAISTEPDARPQPLTAAVRAETVEAACKALEEQYVFPETAAKMAQSVRGKLKAGEYDSIKSESALARKLTEDFRAVSHDLHLRVNVSPKPSESAEQASPAHDGEEEMARGNYAFRKVELLPGNIGYLRFDAFFESEGAKKTASAAMAFLAHCDALIVDLRSNGGGSPEMIRYITSYLFDEPTHLNDMVDREGKTVEEYWTLKEIPGARLPADLPVYVLTSGRTFSGAEEFSYNLKNLKRATIIGQTTGGGAHPVQGVRISDRFMIGVPFMRANNPITKTNWEGKGVAPDIETPADAALDRALAEAKSAIAKRAKH